MLVRDVDPEEEAKQTLSKQVCVTRFNTDDKPGMVVNSVWPVTNKL